jgi:hypothetical protein
MTRPNGLGEAAHASCWEYKASSVTSSALGTCCGASAATATDRTTTEAHNEEFIFAFSCALTFLRKRASSTLGRTAEGKAAGAASTTACTSFNIRPHDAQRARMNAAFHKKKKKEKKRKRGSIDRQEALRQDQLLTKVIVSPNLTSEMAARCVVVAVAILGLLATPALSELICDVKSDCGCPHDGKTDGTDCVRQCVEACHEKAPDRAIVRFTGGVFLTGAFNLTSNMTLLVESSAVILASTDPKHFPVVPALPSYGTCRDDGYPKRHELFRHQAFISGWNIENVEILGGGVIDGQVGVRVDACWFDSCQKVLSSSSLHMHNKSHHSHTCFSALMRRATPGGPSTTQARWTTAGHDLSSRCIVRTSPSQTSLSATAPSGPCIRMHATR